MTFCWILLTFCWILLGLSTVLNGCDPFEFRKYCVHCTCFKQRGNTFTSCFFFLRRPLQLRSYELSLCIQVQQISHPNSLYVLQHRNVIFENRTIWSSAHVAENQSVTWAVTLLRIQPFCKKGAVTLLRFWALAFILSPVRCLSLLSACDC